MSDMDIEVTGDAADVFRQQFNIQSVDQARHAASNLDALWNTSNPWSERGRPQDRETFDWAGKEVEKRFESGRYKPETETQPASHFSPGNKIAARQDGSFKAVSKTPDVCKTPMGSSTPPVPYQVTADLGGSTGVVKNVRFNGKPAYVLNESVVPTCTGDEPGSANGVSSGTVGGQVKPVRGSSTVTIGGNPIIRDGDPCTMNNGNCTGTYVTAPAPSGAIDSSGNIVGDANPPPDKGMLHQVGGFAKGVGGALWDMGKGLVNLGVGAAKLSQTSEELEEFSKLTGLFDYRGFSEAREAAGQTAQAIYNHPKAIVDGITKPYVEAWGQGNYGEALGRGAIDVGGLFVGGVGTVGKVGEAASAAGKVGEAANAAGKAGEAADVAGKAGEAADVADAAGRAGDVSVATERSGNAGVVGETAAKGTEEADGTATALRRLEDADAKPAGDGLKVRPSKDPRYKRGKFRKGVRGKVWEQAKKNSSDGQVRDPVSGKEMSPDEPWDMGHKSGLEHRKHVISAAERNLTRKQFLDEYNDASHYRPELPSSNRSHVGEDLTDDYFGP